MPSSDIHLCETRIRPPHGWHPIDLVDLWHHRELVWLFVWRDIKIRYKQTELGVLWAVIQPLLTTGVFAILFGLIMGRGQEPGVAGVPYILSTFCAMLPWQLFSESMVRSANSLVDSRQLVTKAFFPRAALPIASCGVSVIDFGIRLVLMAVLMVAFGVMPCWSTLWMLPLFMLLALITAIGAGLWLSALSAIYYDFRYAMPFFNQLGFYISPVIYATSKLTGSLPDWATVLYSLNPMVGIIEGFRWAIFGVPIASMLVLVPSLVMSIALLLSGMFFFRRMEQTIVDVI